MSGGDLVGLSGLMERANVEHRLAEETWNQAVRHAINSGAALLEAKAAVPFGEWLRTVEARFEGGERTARTYMRLASNRQRVADLPSIRQAVALLSEPKQPEPEPGPEPAPEPEPLFEDDDRADAELERVEAKFGPDPFSEPPAGDSPAEALDGAHAGSQDATGHVPPAEPEWAGELRAFASDVRRFANSARRDANSEDDSVALRALYRWRNGVYAVLDAAGRREQARRAESSRPVKQPCPRHGVLVLAGQRCHAPGCKWTAPVVRAA